MNPTSMRLTGVVLLLASWLWPWALISGYFYALELSFAPMDPAHFSMSTYQTVHTIFNIIDMTLFACFAALPAVIGGLLLLSEKKRGKALRIPVVVASLVPFAAFAALFLLSLGMHCGGGNDGCGLAFAIYGFYALILTALDEIVLGVLILRAPK